MGTHGLRITWACKACGNERTTTPCLVRDACSKSCALKLRPRKPSTITRICPVCSTSFPALFINGQRKIRCSKACDSKRRAQEKASRQVLAAAEGLGRAVERIAVALRPAPYPELLVCEVCLCTFPRNQAGMRRRLCSAECRRTKTKRLPSTRACRSAAKAARRAKCKAGVKFDPLLVFERDGWCCSLCGIATPPRLRGTMEHNAPELDHVVPLARGGKHSPENTRCLCRSCNAIKGDKLDHELERLLAA